MFTINQENSKYQYTLTNCPKYVDTDFSTFYSDNCNNLHLHRGTYEIITMKKPIHILQLSPAYSTTSPHFHLPQHYEYPALTVNISLDMANLNMVNISSLDFNIWQYLKDQRNETQLHHLSSIPSVPTAQLYKYMISGIKPISPFTSPIESTADRESIWTLFSHRSLCNSYRITYTSRLRDLLLLLLLVSTCLISMLAFITRFYAISYCG